VDISCPGGAVSPIRSHAGWLFLGATAMLATWAYWYGLDSNGIASNGDEGVYIRIARLTAQSSHYLPLQIDLPAFRDTKPPLLFWQAIAATQGGEQWTLWRLRAPSVIYSLLTAALVVRLTRRCSGHWDTALLAGVIFLAFYNTFRYGRPLLTDPPVVFWLTLTTTGFMEFRPRSLESPLLAPLLAGLSVGVACLYKSFALILPVCLILAGWHLEEHRTGVAAFARSCLPRLTLMAVVALAVFSIWFVLDPEPGAIWRDFVLGQNVGKWHGSSGYVHDLFLGGSSIPSLLLALVANGGLLAPVLVAVLIDGWRHRHALTPSQRWLWIWVIGYFVAFSLPSQRSGRYLLPAMPALAALTALAWPSLHRAAFLVSVALALVLAVSMSLLSIVASTALGGAEFSVAYWVLLAITVGLGIGSLVQPRFSPDAVVPMSVLLLLASTSFLRAYDVLPGPFTAATRAALRDKIVWVPCEFAAGEESHRFLLPGADIRAYRQDDHLTPSDLARRYTYFAVYVPLGPPTACAGCTLLGERFLLRGRHAAASWSDVLDGKMLRNLFSREMIFKAPDEVPEQGETRACGG
jgi:4-amino-4-deoxy-L-arabinose transferase-like glycosyltransferase